MADAQDLKSWDRKKSCEFESHHRHQPRTLQAGEGCRVPVSESELSRQRYRSKQLRAGQRSLSLVPEAGGLRDLRQFAAIRPPSLALVMLTIRLSSK